MARYNFEFYLPQDLTFGGIVSANIEIKSQFLVD